MKRLAIIFLALFLSQTLIAQDQTIHFPYLQPQENNDLVYFEGDTEAIILLGEVVGNYHIMGWEPHGRYILSVMPKPELPTQNTIVLLDMDVRESIPLLNEIAVDPVNLFYMDTERVLFTKPEMEYMGDDDQGLSIIRTTVYEWRFNETQSELTRFGYIPYSVGCGGSGVRSTLDGVYSREVDGDTFYEYNRGLLAPTPYGIVHTNGCTAIRTLLTDPQTMDSVELSSDLRWARVSLDGQWVAGTSGNQLQLINLETLEVTTIAEADAPVTSITWDKDSRGFYYVTRTNDGEQVDLDDPNGVLDAYDPNDTRQYPSPEDALQWTSTISRYDLATEESRELHSAEAYAIGTLTPVTDLLVFNQIETPIPWLEASLENPPNLDADLIPVTTWTLNLAYGGAKQVANDLRGMMPRPKP